MLETKSVYLCGPITGSTYKGCSDWRSYAKKKLEAVRTELKVELADGDVPDGTTGRIIVPKFHCINPMRGEESFLKEMVDRPIPARHEEIAKNHPLAADHVQHARDMWDVAEADVLLVNVCGSKFASIGSVGEVSVGWFLRKFILVCGEPGNIHTEHGLFRKWASLILPTLDDGIQYLSEVLYS